ncbi:nucleotidyltransferase [Flavobacterium sp. TN-1]
MARTEKEIHDQILNELYTSSVLDIQAPLSSANLFYRFTRINAAVIQTFEKLMDTHKTQIDTAIYEYKPGTARWYRNMALAFQMGFDLLPDDDQFNNSNATSEQIEASKIVKYCSIPEEGVESSRLIIKIAGEQGDILRKLSDSELVSFTDYIKKIRYAGVKFLIVNNPADKLLLQMKIYVNPLVIGNDGVNIRTGSKSVELALKNYLKSLPFDGELIINDLIAKLREVDGVENVNISNIQSSKYNNDTRSYEGFKSINIKTIPEAGYFELDNQSSLNYVV